MSTCSLSLSLSFILPDAHIDFYARFTSPGVVVAARENDSFLYDYEVTRQVIADLQGAVDARGRTLTVHIIENPTTLRPAWSSGAAGDSFAASYINYYVANGAVVMQNFGDTNADAAAKAKLEELYPGRVVVSIDLDPVAYGGGGIHCATQQQRLGNVTPPVFLEEESGGNVLRGRRVLAASLIVGCVLSLFAIM